MRIHIDENFYKEFREKLEYGEDMEIFFTYYSDFENKTCEIKEVNVLLKGLIFDKKFKVMKYDTNDIKCIMGIDDDFKLDYEYKGYERKYYFTNNLEDFED